MEMLANDDLFICRAGTEDAPNALTCLFPVLIPDDDNELRQYFCDNNLLNVSDVTVSMDGIRVWYLPGPLERIRGLLPNVPPSGPSVHLAGQYWQLTHKLPTYGHQITDVVRIDGLYDGKVVITRYKRTATRHRVRHCETRVMIPLKFLFMADQVIRCTLSHVSDDLFAVQLPRLQPRPQWATKAAPIMPPWIQWVSSKLQSLPQCYSARPYMGLASGCSQLLSTKSS